MSKAPDCLASVGIDSPARVVPLHDGIVPAGEAYEPVVEKLEELLDRARRGEIVGVAYATVSGNGFGGHGWEVAHGPRLAVAGALLALVHRYGESLAEG